MGTSARLISMARSGGYLIASGFTAGEEASVREALTRQALVVSQEVEDEWSALLLQRQ